MEETQVRDCGLGRSLPHLTERRWISSNKCNTDDFVEGKRILQFEIANKLITGVSRVVLYSHQFTASTDFKTCFFLPFKTNGDSVFVYELSSFIQLQIQNEPPQL